MSGDRRNNKMNMTISEQLQAIAGKFCDNYCKYPAVYHDYYLTDRFETEEEAAEAMYCEQCSKCPIKEF